MSTEAVNIVIDSGKGCTKFAVKEPSTQQYRNFSFPTKVQKADNLAVEITKGSYLIELDKHAWLIGDMLSHQLVDADLTKMTETHRICIYTAICSAIQAVQKNIGIVAVNIAVNVPLTISKNEKLREQYENFIRQDAKVIYFTLNKQHVLFRINKLFLIQEGLGSLFIRQGDFRNKKCVQIDIGALNVTASSFYKLIPQIGENFSNSLGTNALYSALREKLSIHYGISIHQQDMEQIIQSKMLIVEGQPMKDSTALIEEALLQHAQQIIQSVKANLSLNNVEIVCVGGGSLLLQEQLQTLLPHCVLEANPQFSTLTSYQRILEAKLHVKQA